MRIRFTKATDVDHISSIPESCYGQLLKRATTRADGKCGPMVHYFRAGAMPDIPDAIAEAYIAAGNAEAVADAANVIWQSREKIMEDVKTS